MIFDIRELICHLGIQMEMTRRPLSFKDSETNKTTHH